MKQARILMRIMRLRQEFSQTFVAQGLGISQGQYSKLENGKTTISLSTWVTFCRLLHLDYNSIFYDVAHTDCTGLPKNMASFSNPIRIPNSIFFMQLINFPEISKTLITDSISYKMCI